MGSKNTTPWTINTVDPSLGEGEDGTGCSRRKAEPLPVDWAGDWKFAGYSPDGCKPVRDCEMNFHILERKGSD